MHSNALRRAKGTRVNKSLSIVYFHSKTKNKSIPHAERTVKRYVIKSLRPAVESAPEADASGASVAARENENRSKRSGSKASHLRSAEEESAGSAFKKSSKHLAKKSPQSAPASVDVGNRVERTPGSVKVSDKSAQKVKSSSSKRSSGRKSAEARRRSSSSVSEAFLSGGDAPSVSLFHICPCVRSSVCRSRCNLYD